MSQKEFNLWIEFFRLYPFDDFHRYYRPAAFIGAAMGADPVKALDWLQPDAAVDGYSLADINTFKAFGITPPIKE